ncbi:hypothetical protein [Providencia alcalifaciens]|uniref:hypothetical protein n=1 Tax=Providencia alcalifaciens TaxID=126385 RepID=UPI00029BC248|nr:hypothetical protein [Providencia alcalifaciens]EKT64688.1 hypothetical protein OO9_12465 [Providencia alcalifaciens Dmel2]
MRKVTDVYSPELAKEILGKHFSNNIEMINIINRLKKSGLCVLAALCEGRTVTTTGYDIDADFCVNRASAVIHALKQKGISIKTHKILTTADVGGMTQQASFSLDEQTLEALKKHPKKTLAECKKELLKHKKLSALKVLTRLCKTYGENEVHRMLHYASTGNNHGY